MARLPPAFRTIVDGRDLIESLSDLFGSKGSWILATGYVEQAEVRLPTDGADTRRLFRGRYALSQFAGPLGGPYGATLSRVDSSGAVDLVSGILVSARSAGVHALCLSGDGEVTLAQSTGGTSAPAAAPIPTNAPVPGIASTNASVPGMSSNASVPGMSSKAAEGGVQVAAGWAAQVNAVAAAQAVPEEEPEPAEPERGDLVQHFAFGLCEVLTANDDKLMIRDLGGPGRIREIRTAMLNVERPTERDGKRLFRLTRKG
ncbi:MAG TPA: hypothetical protein VFQ61_05695 [Polyangiaceae bacterium]|nr:hypothetical protein [Polyangiaceae bacterium]